MISTSSMPPTPTNTSGSPVPPFTSMHLPLGMHRQRMSEVFGKSSTAGAGILRAPSPGFMATLEKARGASGGAGSNSVNAAAGGGGRTNSSFSSTSTGDAAAELGNSGGDGTSSLITAAAAAAAADRAVVDSVNSEWSMRDLQQTIQTLAPFFNGKTLAHENEPTKGASRVPLLSSEKA